MPRTRNIPTQHPTGKRQPLALPPRHRSRPTPHETPRDAESVDAPDPVIRLRAVGSLRPSHHNARTHSVKQIHQIAASIEAFGFTNPILIDADDGIIAGHGRLEAAKLLGMEQIPTIRLDHLTEAQKRAYVIADNKLAELAGWDDELLALEFQYITEIDIDFSVEITGFETAEIDLLIESLEAGEDGSPEDEVPEVADVPPVTRLGDLWHLDEHRLACGDATDPDTYAPLLNGAQAQMVFTDPPYNVSIDGHVCGLGKIKHREFAMASGEMSEAEFTAFLETVLRNLTANSVDGAIHFVCMDWRHLFELLSAGRAAYSELKNLCVWAKTNGGMGSLYRSRHELVAVFKHGDSAHINNVELGRYGRYRTNVWEYAGVNSFGSDRDEALAMHPTVKPVALVEDAILDCSKRGGIVLDAFAGSGTTLIAAEKTGRIGYALELDPRYVDIAVQRWEKVTGGQAVHATSGLTFRETAESRQAGEQQPSSASGTCDATGEETRHDR